MHSLTSTFSLVKFALIATVLGMLSACGTPAPIIITKIERHYVTIPAEMTKSVIPERIMAPVSYMALDLPGREQYLTTYSIGLLKSVAVCNAQLYSIKAVQGKPNEDKP